MKVELRELSMNDGREIFDMIKEIGPGENGYENGGYEVEYKDFNQYLKDRIDMSEGKNLKPQFVPQTTYWLFIDDFPVGIGKLRHYLNDNLRILGGHIGYTIRPSKRQRGYGTIILKELLKKAKEIGIDEVLITCREDNTASKKVIQKNGLGLMKIENKRCYWTKRLIK